MTTYGEVDMIRELLGIDAGQEEEKIVRMRTLSNVMLKTYAPTSVLSNLSDETKNTIADFLSVYLFRLSAGSLSGELGDATFEWKTEAKEMIKMALLQGADVYEIFKVNPP